MATKRYLVSGSYSYQRSQQTYSKSFSYHPDKPLSHRQMGWNPGSGYKYTNCVFVGSADYEGFAIYIGSGDPDAAAVEVPDGTLASATVGKKGGVKGGIVSFGGVSPEQWTVENGSSFYEYSKSVSTNNASWGKISITLLSGSKTSVSAASWVTYPSGYSPDNDSDSALETVSPSTNIIASTASFVGWFVDGGMRNSLPSASDYSATAVFGKKFVLKFRMNGGSGTAISGHTYYYGIEDYQPQGTIPKNTYWKTGYRFAGWNNVRYPTAENPGVTISDEAEAVDVFDDLGLEGGETNVELWAQWEYVLFDISVSKGDTASGATLPSGVGTLNLLDSNGDVVATESNDGLSYVGGEPGSAYTLTCEMPETKPSLLYDANGVYDSTTQTYSQTFVFTPTAGQQLEKVYKFTAKALYAIAVSCDQAATAAGCTASITNPSEADSDGKYVANRTPTITGVPATGYFLSEANVYSGGYNIGTYANIENNAFTLAAISCDISVVCTFSQTDYEIAADIDEASESAIESVTAEIGSQTGEAECTAHYGDTVVFTAVLDEDFTGSFAGFYDGNTCHAGTQDASNPKKYTYSHTVTGAVTLVAKAKVSVEMSIYYDNNAGIESPTESCSVTLAPPSPVVLGNSVDFTLTLGNVSASSTDKWIFDAWFNVATPQTFTDPLEYDASDTLTPTANVSLVARVSSAVRNNIIAVHIENDESSTGAYLDASTALTTDPVADSGGWDATNKQYVLTFVGTKRVRFIAASTIAVGGTELAFNKFVIGSATYGESPIELISNFGTGANGTPGKSMTMWYGAAGTRTVSLAYGIVGDHTCDVTMGSFSITETNDTTTPTPISADGKSATVVRGKTIRIVVFPNNGYKFDGWYASQVKSGDPVATDVDWTMTVNTNRTLYAMFSQDANAVYEWEGSKTKKSFEWRSKLYKAAKPFNPSCCRVDTEGYPLIEMDVEMFSAPDTAYTARTVLQDIASQTARRLPVRRPERFMQICVKNDKEVDAVYVGTNMSALAQ